MNFHCLLSLVLCGGVTLCQGKYQKYIDLSHWLDENSPTWPGHKPFNMTILELGGFGGIKGQAEALIMSTHFGTHIDAPIHIIQNRWTLDQIPIENLQGPAVVINVKRKASREPNYAISKGDIRRFERKHGKIPKRGIVLFNTGWDQKWTSKTDFLGIDSSEPTKVNSPGLGLDAAEYLLQKKNIVGIGVDTVSYDVGNSVTLDAHKAFSAANKWGLENVANLDQMRPTGCDVIVLPLKLIGASGAPARVIAYCPQKEDSDSGKTPTE